MADLPKNLRELHRVCRELAAETLPQLGGGRVELEGDQCGLRLWYSASTKGALFYEERLDEEEDDDGAPTVAEGDAGRVIDRAHLARLLGRAMGLGDAVQAAADPVAYLRERAETGVDRA